MRGFRRFSQAISEGDGISLLADVRDAESARSAEEDGAEGIVVRGELDIREVTELPILSLTLGLEDAARLGADACVLRADGNDEELAELYGRAVDLGLDCVVAVRDEEELAITLERLDPEIFLLSASGAGNGDGLEHVLELLQDVPAGKLAVAEADLTSREEVAELERAGTDAVIVRAEDVARLIGTPVPEF